MTIRHKCPQCGYELEFVRDEIYPEYDEWAARCWNRDCKTYHHELRPSDLGWTSDKIVSEGGERPATTYVVGDSIEGAPRDARVGDTCLVRTPTLDVFYSWRMENGEEAWRPLKSEARW